MRNAGTNITIAFVSNLGLLEAVPSPKRKSIKAYEDFVAGGGNLYVPTPAQKASFKKAASPVYDWFKSNVKNGTVVFNALTYAVSKAEANIAVGMTQDLN